MASSNIVTCAFVTVASTTASSFLSEDQGGKGEGLPSSRLIFGSLLAFAGIGILDGFAPEVARLLSIMVAGTAFVQYGLPIISAVFVTPPKKKD